MKQKLTLENVVTGFAYVFNRTALGLGVLMGLNFLINEQWLEVSSVIVMIGIYFALHRAVNAP
jgi:hypothetical protein